MQRTKKNQGNMTMRNPLFGAAARYGGSEGPPGRGVGVAAMVTTTEDARRTTHDARTTHGRTGGPVKARSGGVGRERVGRAASGWET